MDLLLDAPRLPDLAAFRRWVHSDDLPQRGRIDWIGGQVEIDVAPEEINTHGTLKACIARALAERIEDADLGVVLIDSTRLTNPTADLSVEPDVLVLLDASVSSGRARLVPKADAADPPQRFVEIEGAVDLVVECVSDSSTTKDLTRLPPRYFQAGVPELWIVDARHEPLVLAVHRAGAEGYERVEPDADGYSALRQRSSRRSQTGSPRPRAQGTSSASIARTTLGEFMVRVDTIAAHSAASSSGLIRPWGPQIAQIVNMETAAWAWDRRSAASSSSPGEITHSSHSSRALRECGSEYWCSQLRS